MRWGWWSSALLLLGAAHAQAEPISADQERALKRAHAAPLVVALPIDWTSAAAARRSLPLPADAQSRVATARQPVLLPAMEALLDRAFVTVGQGWYTAALPGDGVHVEIQGTAVSHVRPGLVAEQAAAGYGTGAPRVAMMHQIFTVSFERFGISYSLDVECASAGDPRCADANYAMAVFDSLVVAGGRP